MSLLVVQKVDIFNFTKKAFEEVRVCGKMDGTIQAHEKILLFVIPRMDLESIMLIEMSDRENKTQ